MTVQTEAAVQEDVSPMAQAWWEPLRSEVGFAAELAALTSLVFARPVLGSFGASPETFIARDAGAIDVVVFGLAVVLIPLAATVALGAVSAPFGQRIRLAVHLAIVVGLTFLGTLQVLRVHSSLSDALALAAAAALALTVGLWRWRAGVARTFLRYAGVASLVFLIQFLVFSPTASLVWGARSGGPDPDDTAVVSAALGDDAPPVVIVVLDALPTTSLLDAEGNIHADVYPNLAALARDGAWYRNHTTVAAETLHALPAILTGAVPDAGDVPPVASAYPRNLFTLLGGVYELNVAEQVTALCPSSLCPDTGDGDVMNLLDDARTLWRDSFDARHQVIAGLPGAFGHRYQGFAEWIEAQDFAAPDSLFFYHAMLPHEPWNWLPGGQRYQMSYPPFGTFLGRWGPVGAEVGLQRQMLQTQAVDELLGRMFDRMRRAGVYEDALVVVTADHGAAFTPDEPLRPMSEVQFEQIMWTPLIVKPPGEAESGIGETVNDHNVLSVDILPAIADGLGIDLEELGWEVDGVAPRGAPPRDPADKMVLDWGLNDLRAPDGEDMINVDGEEGLRRVLAGGVLDGTGPQAAWRRTRYGALLGAKVEDLRQAEPLDVALEVENLDWFGDVVADSPPLEFLGFGWIEPDESLAIAVNGTVVGLAPARETPFGVSIVHVLLQPEAFVAGRNELDAYHIEGPVDEPVLRPVELVPRGG